MVATARRTTEDRLYSNLVHVPAGDINFRCALDEADVEMIAKAIAATERGEGFAGKTKLKTLQARLNRRVKEEQKASPAYDLEGGKSPDPRTVPGACVKTPGGLRAYVEGADPKDGGRVLISYESKALGSDSYQPSNLTLVQPSPDQPTTAQAAVVTKTKPDTEQVLEAHNDKAVTRKSGVRPLLDRDATVHPSDPLSDLATQINALHSQGDEAEATAIAAGQAALQLRKAEGDRLLEAKAQVKHGQWGKWLKANCPDISERSCQLYMRLAEGWEHIAKNETVADLTFRDAIALLPKKTKPPMPPREPSAYDYTPMPEPKPCWFKVGDSWTEGQAIAANQRNMTRIIWGENRQSDIPNQQVRWSKPLEALTVEDVLLYELEQEATGRPTQPPSITPAAATGSDTPTIAPPVACQLCQHRTHVNSSEYCCEMDEFDDVIDIAANIDTVKQHCLPFFDPERGVTPQTLCFFPLAQSIMQKFRSTPFWGFETHVAITSPGDKQMFFSGRTEQEIEQYFQASGLITPWTRRISKGFGKEDDRHD